MYPWYTYLLHSDTFKELWRDCTCDLICLFCIKYSVHCKIYNYLPCIKNIIFLKFISCYLHLLFIYYAYCTFYYYKENVTQLCYKIYKYILLTYWVLLLFLNLFAFLLLLCYMCMNISDINEVTQYCLWWHDDSEFSCL